MTMAATVSDSPTTTNAPIAFLFAGLLIIARPLLFPPRQEAMHSGVLALGQQLFGIAVGDHGFLVRIEEDRVVADGENAGQLVRDDHHGGAKALAQL